MINLATALYFIRQQYRTFTGEIIITSDKTGVCITIGKPNYSVFLRHQWTWEEIEQWLEKINDAL